MKYTYLILFFFTLICTESIQAQEGENYIRIVGLAEKTINASGIDITLQLKEIKRDEYQKIREKNIDQIKAELIANLKTIGIPANQLEEVWPPTNSYGNQKQETYTIKVKNKDKAREISKFEIKGFACTKFAYYYDNKETVDSSKLALTAIDDARRKAEALAIKAGKKIGKVIRIEDKNAKRDFTPNSYNNKDFSTFVYALTVTYELFD